MPRPRDPTLRTRLIDAGEVLIREGGPGALAARPAATAAGCSLGAIYAAFPTLDHLGEAINLRTLERLSATLTAISDADPERRFRRTAMAYLEFGAANPHLWRAVFALPRPPAPSPDVVTPLQEATAPLFALAETLVQEIAGPGDVATRSRAVWAGLQGLAQLAEDDAVNAPGERSPDDVAAAYVDIVVAGLRRPK